MLNIYNNKKVKKSRGGGGGKRGGGWVRGKGSEGGGGVGWYSHSREKWGVILEQINLETFDSWRVCAYKPTSTAAKMIVGRRAVFLSECGLLGDGTTEIDLLTVHAVSTRYQPLLSLFMSPFFFFSVFFFPFFLLDSCCIPVVRHADYLCLFPS